MTKGGKYIVFLMKVYDPSGLSEVEEKQQFQTIVKKDLQDLERIVTQEKDSQRERESEREIAD